MAWRGETTQQLQRFVIGMLVLADARPPVILRAVDVSMLDRVEMDVVDATPEITLGTHQAVPVLIPITLAGRPVTAVPPSRRTTVNLADPPWDRLAVFRGDQNVVVVIQQNPCR